MRHVLAADVGVKVTEKHAMGRRSLSVEVPPSHRYCGRVEPPTCRLPTGTWHVLPALFATGVTLID